jgi:hypothetical protein
MRKIFLAALAATALSGAMLGKQADGLPLRQRSAALPKIRASLKKLPLSAAHTAVYGSTDHTAHTRTRTMCRITDITGRGAGLTWDGPDTTYPITVTTGRGAGPTGNCRALLRIIDREPNVPLSC